MFNNLGFNIPVIEGGFGENQKVILAKTIAEIHGVTTPDINKLINRNITRLTQNDLIDLKNSQSSNDQQLLELDFTNMQISKSNNIFLLSERGYTKLVSMMDNTNEIKWQVMDKLIDEYFAMRAIIKSDEQLKAMAEIHEMELKKVNELINKNIDEFEHGVDIIDLKSGYLESIEFLSEIFNKQSIANSKNIYLLSEQGYFALVGFMKTEKAKEIRKMLRREYFTMRAIINYKNTLVDLAISVHYII